VEAWSGGRTAGPLIKSTFWQQNALRAAGTCCESSLGVKFRSKRQSKTRVKGKVGTLGVSRRGWCQLHAPRFWQQGVATSSCFGATTSERSCPSRQATWCCWVELHCSKLKSQGKMFFVLSKPSRNLAVRMASESPNHPASPVPIPPSLNRKARSRSRRGVGWVNTGQFHEQPEIFMGAGPVDVLNVSTARLHSGGKGCSTLAAATVQVPLESRRSCGTLVTWKVFRRWKRAGKRKSKRRGRQPFGAMPFME